MSPSETAYNLTFVYDSPLPALEMRLLYRRHNVSVHGVQSGTKTRCDSRAVSFTLWEWLGVWLAKVQNKRAT